LPATPAPETTPPAEPQAGTEPPLQPAAAPEALATPEISTIASPAVPARKKSRRKAQAAASSEPSQENLESTEMAFHHSQPESAFSGVTLTLDIYSPQPIAGGSAMARRIGEAPFHEFPVKELPDHYYAIDLPPDLCVAPGLEYYLVFKDPKDGEKRHLAYKSPIDPAKVTVEGGLNAGPALEQFRYGHRLRAFAESYSYPGITKMGNTDVLHMESEYSHRFSLSPFTVRYGQGLYKTHSPRPLSFSASTYDFEPGFFYSFLGFDFRPQGSRLALSLKGLGGALLNRTGTGINAELSYGEEEGMNVALTFRGIETVGQWGGMSMRLRPFSNVVLGLGAEITNMPDFDTLGLREYGDIEFSLTRQLKLLGRGGVASRQAGVASGDFGGGLSYEF
jgi:hypothetical protein